MSINTYMHTVAPELYRVIKPIPVTIQKEEENFTASWFDANIHMSGDNEQEAFDNLRALVLDMFESVNQENPAMLGPEPARQRAVLEEYLSR